MIRYSRGRNINDNRPRQVEVADFAAFFAAVDRDRAPHKARAPYICGPLNGNGRRCAEGAASHVLLAVDLDRIDPDRLPDVRMWFTRFAGCGWPTHSSTPEAPRERVIIHLDRPATRDECIAIGRTLDLDLAEEFGDAIMLDVSTFRPEQPVFVAPTGVQLARFDGEPLDVARYVAASPPVRRDVFADPHTGELQGKVTAGARHAHLLRHASQANWRGLPPEAIHAALQAENLRACSPPKTAQEVETIAQDVVRRYAGQHGRDLVAPAAQEDAEQRRARQRQRAQDIGDGAPGLLADELRKTRELDQLLKQARDGQRRSRAEPSTEEMDLSEMRDKLVFIGDGSRVAQRDRPHIALPLPEFKLLTRASQTRVGKKLVPTVDLWVEDPQRISTHTITYRPGHPEFTTDPEGAPALNLWADRQRAPAVASVAPFLDHIRYLVGDVAECERFLDWLAHIEQHPGVLPHTHYLMVAQQTGIGRNWLASLLARVWAGATRLGFDLVGAMQSGFNGALSRRLLVIVDELKTADTGYGAVNHGQQLKAMLTTEHRGINPKFGRQHTEFNCARWLMLSQHYDALPLERNDRRVIVISNPSERKPADYFRRLYQLLDEPAFTGAVGHWLGQRDISGFNPSEPAPLTVAKGKAIDACIGDVERALIDLRTGTDAQVMRSTQIMEYLQDCGLRPPAGRSLSAAYAAAGMVPCARLVTWQGKKHRVVSLREGARLKDASAADLLELLVASK